MLLRSLRLLIATALVGLTAAPALALTIFQEDFDGYTSFPSQNPSGDFVNNGLPKPSEGADQTWYGVRFENSSQSVSSIDGDLFVQKCGDFVGSNCHLASGSGNKTPVGRFEDDAGIMLKVSTVGFENVTLNFDWRTFGAESGDRFRVGYYAATSAIPLTTIGGSGYANLSSGTYAWSNWTQLFQGGATAPFQAGPTLSLPGGVEHLYVVFWLDNGEGDNGKVDNVIIQGDVVPEPAAALLLLAPLGWLIARRSR
jgi:hypothetical protein